MSEKKCGGAPSSVPDKNQKRPEPTLKSLRDTAQAPSARYPAAIAALDALHFRFPKAIAALSARHRKPLAVGIRQSVIAAAPDIDPRVIGLALRLYVRAPRYWRSMIEGVVRIGIDGEPDGVVTKAEAESARQQLSIFFARRLNKSTTRASHPKRRISLADLREAARQRHTARGAP